MKRHLELDCGNYEECMKFETFKVEGCPEDCKMYFCYENASNYHPYHEDEDS